MLFTILLTIGLNLGNIETESVPLTDHEVITESSVTGNVILETDDDLTDNEEEPILLLSEPSYDLQILQELQKSNNYWDLFLDSYPVHNVSNIYIVPNVVANNGETVLRVNSQGVVQELVLSNPYYFSFVYKLPNGHYTFSLNQISKSYNYFGFSRSLTPGTRCFYSISQPGADTYWSTEFDVTDDFPCWILCSGNGTTSNLYSLSNPSIVCDNVTYDSYTLSEIGNAITSVDTKVDILTDVTRLLECIVFIESCLLIIPWLHKITKKERSL